MSAQGATLGRGTAHLPIWPVAALVVTAAAVMIGMSVIDSARPEGSAAVVTDVERFANSSAALREQGGVAVTIPALNPAAIEASSAAIREQGGAAFHAQGRAHEVIVGVAAATTTSIVGLENPGAYVTGAPTYATGLENPGAYQPNAIEGKAEPHTPIVAGGEPCHQCR